VGLAGYLADMFASVPRDLVGTLDGDWPHEKRMDGGRKVRRDFFDAVKRMEPADAWVFDAMSKFLVVGSVREDLGVSMERLRPLANEAGIPGIGVDVSIDTLVAVNCFRRNQYGQPMLTPFGSALHQPS
jgi:hypothetical protein